MNNEVIGNLIPEVYAAMLLKSKEKVHVFANLANRNYEGQIRAQGDRVRIRQIGEITISDYTKNSTSALTEQTLTDAETYLDIDQAKVFNFYVDDVDQVQADIEFMGEAMRKASYKLNDTADTYLAGLYAQAGIVYGSTAVALTSTNFNNTIVLLGQKMDEANVGREGRFIVAPPWFFSKALLAGVSNLTENNNTLINGFIGRYLGFDLYLSNNVYKTSTAWAGTEILAGIRGESFTFAEQIAKIESLRSQDKFGNLYRGLHVYGGKIIQPNVTARLTADNTAES